MLDSWTSAPDGLTDSPPSLTFVLVWARKTHSRTETVAHPPLERIPEAFPEKTQREKKPEPVVTASVTARPALPRNRHPAATIVWPFPITTAAPDPEAVEFLISQL